MSNPCGSALELLGLLVGLAAWLCSLATTLLPRWQTLSMELLLSEGYERGLWETCVAQDLGGMNCRPYDSLLGLDGDVRLSRIFMCLADAVGLLALLLAVPGLRQVNSCGGEGGRRAKRSLRLVGGALELLAGGLVLFPVSYVAHETVRHFFDESVPDIVPRWEFGDALFVGWAGGFLHVVSAALFFASCSGSPWREPRLVYHRRRHEIQTVDLPSDKRTEYV